VYYYLTVNEGSWEVLKIGSPNLTMNLTYLCYGSSKVNALILLEKGICLKYNI